MLKNLKLHLNMQSQFWNNMELNNIFKVFDDFNQHTDDYLGAMFINIFKKFPDCYRIYFNNNKEISYIHNTEPFENINAKLKYKLDLRIFLKNCYDNSSKYNIKVFPYSYNEHLVLYEDNDCCFLINSTMTDREDASYHYEEIYTTNIDKAFNMIKDWFKIAQKPSKVEFGIAAIDPSISVYTTWYDYNTVDIDISKNYNDDIPYKEICDILENDKSSLILFYGDPGTGKTSLIKHFISKYEDKDFVFMDGSLLKHASKEKLMAYFLESQNTIFILEDCEEALKNRNSNYNPVMPVLLNLTDGIIGDVLGIKLICTFNTGLSNIDKALLRKGRLSLKYEFKKLDCLKASKILGRTVPDMSLADIYYDKEENDFSKNNSKKIGF